MCIPRDDLKWIARAPAKLNLFLEIGERRGDGFHDLETLIVPIRIWDSLCLAVTRLTKEGTGGPITLALRQYRAVRPPSPSEAIPAGSDNLVCRALALLQQRSGCRWGAAVQLVKRIPSAAGLGGGSSDAAAALCLANRAWQLNWPVSRLAEVAAEVGSDVPFFLEQGPAVCRGRGERVQRLPGMPGLDFVVLKPPFGLGTSEVYRAHDALRCDDTTAARVPSAPSIAAGSRRWGDLRGWMHNRLQAAAATLSPWVQRVSRLFDQLDFAAHQLSGSGSAYFGVCRNAQHARRLAAVLRTQRLGLVYATRSCP